MLTVQNETAIDDAVETLKFLSDRNRLRILMALTRAETCVCDLIDELGLAQPLVSYHLARLKKAGVVRSRRDAQWMYYSLDPDAWACLTAPLASLLGPVHLTPEAAFGASERCLLIPPDPVRGACDGDRIEECC